MVNKGTLVLAEMRKFTSREVSKKNRGPKNRFWDPHLHLLYYGEQVSEPLCSSSLEAKWKRYCLL